MLSTRRNGHGSLDIKVDANGNVAIVCGSIAELTLTIVSPTHHRAVVGEGTRV